MTKRLNDTEALVSIQVKGNALGRNRGYEIMPNTDTGGIKIEECYRPDVMHVDANVTRSGLMGKAVDFLKK